MERLLLDLEKILQEEIAQHNKLLSLMQQERQYVIKGQIDLLGESNKQKETIILEIKMFEEGRLKIIEKLAEYNNLHASELTMKRLIFMVPPPFQQRFQDYFNILQKLIKDLTNLNKNNAVLIERSLDFINDSLNILTNGAYSNSVYSAKGKLDQQTNLQSNSVYQSI